MGYRPENWQLPSFFLYASNQFGWHCYESDPLPFLPPSYHSTGIKDSGEMSMLGTSACVHNSSLESALFKCVSVFVLIVAITGVLCYIGDAQDPQVETRSLEGEVLDGAVAPNLSGLPSILSDLRRAHRPMPRVSLNLRLSRKDSIYCSSGKSGIGSLNTSLRSMRPPLISGSYWRHCRFNSEQLRYTVQTAICLSLRRRLT